MTDLWGSQLFQNNFTQADALAGDLNALSTLMLALAAPLSLVGVPGTLGGVAGRENPDMPPGHDS